MSVQLRPPDVNDPLMQSAIAEMEKIILDAFPGTVFTIEHGDDPVGVYLVATVDVDDTDAVEDLYVDRLVDLQLEHGLRLHVLPLRTPERIAALLEANRPAVTQE
jgi:hypothetical protein